MTVKALIVDDNEKIARSTAMAFEVLGCETAVSVDSTKTASMAEDFKPDIIILDIGMPGKNGYEVCRDLRNNGFKNALIVAHTGWGSEKDMAKAEEAGFDEVLIKPVKMKDFERQLEKLSPR
jgi:DNA-binding response OmpR family regulator